MPIGKSGWLFVAALALLAWHYAPRALSFADSTHDRGVYYRLLAKYQHGDEIIDFDIVVGCNVRVTRYGDGDKSYDALRDPVVYAKATNNGHAVMQMVPSACLGQTTDNGEVPEDFLPGALWFENAGDFSLGIGYVTDDAFEGPKSQLKFLGASIHAATRDEWLAFEPSAAKNLFNPKPLFSYAPLPDTAEVKRNLGNSRRLSELLPFRGCYVVTRVHLTSPEDRAIIGHHWPTDKPRFWRPSNSDFRKIFEQLQLYTRVEADGRPFRDYLRLNYETSQGFPTRTHGGVIGSKHRPYDKLPPTIFPLQRDEGIPWVSTTALTAKTLYRNVDLGTGANRGRAYCYAELSGDQYGFPAYASGSFSTLVDELPIVGEDANTDEPLHARPRPFFENDEYFYFQDDFSIN
jgi:hypothetical protein